MSNEMTYLSDSEAKMAIIEVGKRMYSCGFVAANDGNISCRVGESQVWSTPTGVSKGFMSEDMLVKVDLDGNVLSGSWKPTSELKMHLRVYREAPEIHGVVHAHPPRATAFAIAGIPLKDPIMVESILTLGDIPVAAYARPGTQEVPDSVAPYVKDHHGLLLANHGAITWGRTLYSAWYKMEEIEQYAAITMYTRYILGKQNLLTEDQIGPLAALRK
ncbi:MAG: class II aldolase/adducin family protein [Oscillospiraceae bacterium]